MEWILAVVGIVLALAVLGLLVWLIAAVSANRRDQAAHAGGITLLQQQLESLKTAQDGTRETLQKSLQTGQTSLSQSLQSSQKVLSQLNSQIGELQAAPPSV